jgi:hypothetical protein
MKTFNQLVLETLSTLLYEATFFCPGFNKLTPQLQDKVVRTFETYSKWTQSHGLCSTFNIFDATQKNALKNSEMKIIDSDEEGGPQFVITNISYDSHKPLGLESLLFKISTPISNQFIRDGMNKHLEKVRDDDIYRKKIEVDYQLYRTLKYTIKDQYYDLKQRVPELEGVF